MEVGKSKRIAQGNRMQKEWHADDAAKSADSR